MELVPDDFTNYKVSPCGDCPAKGCGSFHDECIPYQKYKAVAGEIAKKRRDTLQTEGLCDNILFKKSRFKATLYSSR